MYGSPYEINTVSSFFAFFRISLPSSTNHRLAILNSPFEISSNCFFSVSEMGLVNDSKYTFFAFLGVLKLRDEVNCLRSVTGASKDHSSGKIYFPHMD